MDAATVQALRDAKALKDEGILTDDEFKAKKAELLARKSTPAAAPPAPAPAKKEPAAKKEKKPRKKKEVDPDAPPKEKKAKKAAPLTLQDAGADGVLVTGDGTFRAKGLLSSNGGSWNKKLKAWVFGAGTATELAAALQASTSPPVELTVASPSPGAKAAREQSLESAKADAIEKAAASGAEATLELAAHKKAVIVRGDTKKVKELLSALGGSWNNKLDGWVFPGKERGAVLDALRKDPTNTVSDDGKGEAPPSQPGPSAEDAEAAVAAVVADIPDDPYASPPADDAKPAAPASSGRKSKADRRSGSLGSPAEPAPAKRKSVDADAAEEALPEEPEMPEKRRRSSGPPADCGYSA